MSQSCGCLQRDIASGGTPEERFDRSYIENAETGCWEWSEHLSPKGYGIINIKTYPRRAHRFAYERFVGPIPEGAVVCHKCDNPKCVNPAHLFVGISADNVADKVRKGRQATGRNVASSVLTDDAVKEIRRLAAYMTQTDIAKMFGVTQANVSEIVRRKTWRHIPEA